MKQMKWTLLTLVALMALPLQLSAQDDDMYFVPTRQNVQKQKAEYGLPAGTSYSGSSRSVDDYNRRGSNYQVFQTDSLGDVIDFSPVLGVYPDSTADFQLTQQMARFDGYEPSAAYWEGYRQGRDDASWNYMGWHSPWYYGTAWYPWYDPWYDPWYYGSWGWYGGWYDPWYYSWGWGYPYHHYGWYGSWYGGGHYGGLNTQRHGRVAGSGAHGFGTGRSVSYSSGRFGGSRMGQFGGSRSSSQQRSSYGGTRTTRPVSGGYSNSNGNFGGSRSSGNSSGSFGGTRSSGSSGGGSFGGSRSGGSSGGSRSGGGSFGGGRRR